MECAHADTFTTAGNRHCPNHGGCGLRMRAVMSAVPALAAGRSEPRIRVPVRRAVVPGVPGKERRAILALALLEFSPRPWRPCQARAAAASWVGYGDAQ